MANDSCGVADIMEQQIERLQQDNRTTDGWKDVKITSVLLSMYS